MKDFSKGGIIWICGTINTGKSSLAKALYNQMRNIYGHKVRLFDRLYDRVLEKRLMSESYEAYIKRLTFLFFEIVRQGGIVIAANILGNQSIRSMISEDIRDLNRLEPFIEATNTCFILCKCGVSTQLARDKKCELIKFYTGEISRVPGKDTEFDYVNEETRLSGNLSYSENTGSEFFGTYTLDTSILNPEECTNEFLKLCV